MPRQMLHLPRQKRPSPKLKWEGPRRFLPKRGQKPLFPLFLAGSNGPNLGQRWPSARKQGGRPCWGRRKESRPTSPHVGAYNHPLRAAREFARPTRQSRSGFSASKTGWGREVVKCGGKRSATPLWLAAERSAVPAKAPSPLRSAGALQKRAHPAARPPPGDSAPTPGGKRESRRAPVVGGTSVLASPGRALERLARTLAPPIQCMESLCLLGPFAPPHLVSHEKRGQENSSPSRTAGAF